MCRICVLIKAKGRLMLCCMLLVHKLNIFYVLCYATDGKPEASIYEVKSTMRSKSIPFNVSLLYMY